MRVSRSTVLLEICLAFMAMHLAFRGFREFTAWGQAERASGMQWSPGLSMVLVSLIMMRGKVSYLFSRANALPGCRSAAMAMLLSIGVGCLFWMSGWPLNLQGDDWIIALRIGAGNLLLAAALLAVFSWHGLPPQSKLARRLGFTIAGLLLVIAIAPVAWSSYRGEGFGHVFASVVWILLFSAVGEELFFRGYIQGRCNQVFGRRWRIGRTSFGPGLFLAAGFFGFVHVLNPYDYFAQSGSLYWQHGLTTATAMSFGILREYSGNLWAPILVHGFGNLAARMPELLSA